MKAPIVLTKTQRAMLRRALKILIRATIDDSEKGGGHPEDVPFIESDLRSARALFWSLFQDDDKKS